ncbi:MAG: signal recognition particle-docking protein FtsY [Phycisphaerales bacterium]|nr:signal recognition particle-docking protein FtsY [Phycisphaerales bacterium]
MALFGSAISKIRKGLTATRDALMGGAGDVVNFLRGRRIDAAMLEELEARLIRADLGVRAARRLVDGLRADFRAGKIERGEQVIDYLKRELKAMWPAEDRRLAQAPAQPGAHTPTVILVAGVNGAGKTTSIAKLARLLRSQDKSVVLAACDTFRAGAVHQLEIWSERLGVQIVKGKQGGDPGAVAFDACEAAVARRADVLIVDTAGRLHTQDHLMRQLVKVRDIIAKKIPGAPHEVLLVLDATSGQNAIRQAEEFSKAIGVTGIFLAKLDGTAKGGVVVAIREALGAPVKFVGVGETVDDVQAFDPDQFVEALFADEEPATRS